MPVATTRRRSDTDQRYVQAGLFPETMSVLGNRWACAVLVAAFLCVHEMGHQGAVLGVGLNAFGLTVEGLFLVSLCQRDVLPELRARAGAAINPEVFEGVVEG